MRYTAEEYPNGKFQIAATKRDLLLALEPYPDDTKLFIEAGAGNLCEIAVIVFDETDPFIVLEAASDAPTHRTD